MVPINKQCFCNPESICFAALPDDFSAFASSLNNRVSKALAKFKVFTTLPEPESDTLAVKSAYYLSIACRKIS